MDNREEKIIRHLEMIQGIINRLVNNSLFIKSWSITILSAILIFMSDKKYQSQYIILAFILVTISIITFWLLDGYFLWQERLFRNIYNDVRQKDTTDFKMDLKKAKKNNSYWKTILSKPLFLFYIVIIFISISIAVFIHFTT